ncbi:MULTISPECIES: hypothetical protein [unclassified Streptomyces]|uniref:hypothetical protein n=1 Tax=unclassified Streptomyces TaxID=2593676 RepID=UPI00278C313B|nr:MULTISPECIES: hypothetical protein [unclassified Streptomyces]
MTSATPYRLTRHPDTLTFQWTVQEADGERELTATGTCPTCGCPTTRSFGPIQPLIAKGGFLNRRQEPDEAESLPWNTSCQCEGYHQPRPADRGGCGALLTLAPPPAAALHGLQGS